MSKSRLSFPFSFLLSSSRPGHGLPRPPLVQPLRSQNSLGKYALPSQQQSRFSTGAVRHRAPETTGQRYGTAIEPPPHLGGGNSQPASNSNLPEKASTKAVAKDSTSAAESYRQSKPSEPATSEATSGQQEDPVEQADKELDEIEQGVSQQLTPGNGQETNAASQTNDIPADPNNLGNPDESALKSILGTEWPMSPDRAEKPPHLEPPPYIHHFDTYTLVRSLEEGGFSEAEAVIVMKAVRAILADNMDLARDGLVSKGDAEMTAYLFRSACTELRTEMRNKRAAMNERMQSERNTLQHEVDVISQRITAETSSLKDELKGMFDDRKMAVRMERRDLENQIQEVNYKITTRLNSEMKSETEGLRWVLVRRTAISIAIVTATALITLKIMQTAEKRKENEVANAARETFYSGESSESLSSS